MSEKEFWELAFIIVASASMIVFSWAGWIYSKEWERVNKAWNAAKEGKTK
jgi:hypothetical protein